MLKIFLLFLIVRLILCSQYCDNQTAVEKDYHFAEDGQQNYIFSKRMSNFGTWGDWQVCNGKHVNGFQLKYLYKEEIKDNVALTGIRLHCVDGELISSKEGDLGLWHKLKRCEPGYFMIGFQLRVEPTHCGDNTATNNIRIMCNNPAKNETIHVTSNCAPHWGIWSDKQVCGKGTAVCGIATQVQDEVVDNLDDNTFLNNLKMICCKFNSIDYI